MTLPPLRRTPLRAKPRSKGNRGEAEIVDILKGYGWPAYRNFMSGGYGGSDIVGGPPGTALEVKRCEAVRIWEWLEQAQLAAKPTDTPIVIFRRNRSRWYACLPLDDCLELLKLREL